MNEEIEQNNQEEEEELTCPECGKGFQDMRGLTSHVRHIHDIGKEELNKYYKMGNDNGALKILGGISAVLLTLITFGKLK